MISLLFTSNLRYFFPDFRLNDVPSPTRVTNPNPKIFEGSGTVAVVPTPRPKSAASRKLKWPSKQREYYCQEQ